MGLKEVFRLSKSKIMVDFLVAILMIIIIVFNSNFFYRYVLSAKPLYWQIGWILLNIVIAMVIYYPLSCGFVFIYEAIFKKKKKINRNSIIIAILAILLLNPLTYSLLYRQNSGVNTINNKSCNIIVTGFTDNSPAKNSGMQEGEVLVQVNGYDITNLDSLVHSLADKRAGDSVVVKTDTKEYNLIAIGEENSSRVMLGIKAGEFCGL